MCIRDRYYCVPPFSRISAALMFHYFLRFSRSMSQYLPLIVSLSFHCFGPFFICFLGCFGYEIHQILHARIPFLNGFTWLVPDYYFHFRFWLGFLVGPLGHPLRSFPFLLRWYLQFPSLLYTCLLYTSRCV